MHKIKLKIYLQVILFVSLILNIITIYFIFNDINYSYLNRSLDHGEITKIPHHSSYDNIRLKLRQSYFQNNYDENMINAMTLVKNSKLVDCSNITVKSMLYQLFKDYPEILKNWVVIRGDENTNYYYVAFIVKGFNQDYDLLFVWTVNLLNDHSIIRYHEMSEVNESFWNIWKSECNSKSLLQFNIHEQEIVLYLINEGFFIENDIVSKESVKKAMNRYHMDESEIYKLMNKFTILDRSMADNNPQKKGKYPH